MPRTANLKHGKTGTYANHGCRCERCTKAIRRYQNRRYNEKRKTPRSDEPEPENLALKNFTPQTFNAFALTHLACVYVWRDPAGQVLYVGSTEALHRRLSTHNIISAVTHADTITVYPTRTVEERHQLEKNLIENLHPQFNKLGVRTQ